MSKFAALESLEQHLDEVAALSAALGLLPEGAAQEVRVTLSLMARKSALQAKGLLASMEVER